MNAPAQALASVVLRKRGDRVVVKASRNEWYTGTVTKATPDFLWVKFDDKATSKIAESDFPDVKTMLLDYVSPDPLTDAGARPLYMRTAPRPSSVKVKLEPAAEASPADTKLLSYTDSSLYLVVQGSNSPAQMLRWMKRQWATMNRVYFKSLLSIPVFEVLTFAQEQKHKIGGLWKADSRTLCLGQSVFENSEIMLLKALLHVMCHQAVSEIDGKVGVGHSESWTKWMARTTFPAHTQTDIVHDVPYMLEFEPASFADLPVKPGAVAAPDLAQFYRMPKNDAPAIWRTKAGVLKRGLLLGSSDPEATSGIFLTVPSSDRYTQVELSDVYVMPDTEAAEFRSPLWRSGAKRVRSALGLDGTTATLEFKRGDRVVVRMGSNSWATGDVTAVTDVVQVTTDLGMRLDVPPEDFGKLRRINTKRKSVNLLTDKLARALR